MAFPRAWEARQGRPSAGRYFGAPDASRENPAALRDRPPSDFGNVNKALRREALGSLLTPGGAAT